MRVLVCGGRKYRDGGKIHEVLSRQGVTLLIHGDCSGADRLAGAWADENAIPCMAFPAPWNSHLGRAAGPIRNKWMVEFGQPELVIAFPGDRGTRGMIAIAQSNSIPVIEVD